MWIGKNLVPRLMIYSYFFMGAFAAEISLILLSFVIGGLVVEARLLLLTGMTLIAMLLFRIEGSMLQRKLNLRRAE